MKKQNEIFQEVKNKLINVRELYSAYDDEQLFLFELKLVILNDANELLPILKADTIEIQPWYTDSLKIKFSTFGHEEIREKAISYEIIEKVGKMMDETTFRMEN